MLRNFLLISYRNIRQNKGASLLNIFCLALGMATCLFIFNYVYYELTYERFHNQSRSIYRVETNTYQHSDLQNKDAFTAYKAGQMLATEFEEISTYASLVPYSENSTAFFGLPRRGSTDKQIYIERAYYSSPAILDIFSVNLLAGNKTTALNEANTIILSTTMIRKIFGETSGYDRFVGTVLKPSRQDLETDDFTITGVFEDIPENTHLRFDALVSESSSPTDLTLVPVDNSYNYVLLSDKSVASVNAQLTESAKRNITDAGIEKRLSLAPIRQIHTASRISNEPGTTINRLFLTFLTVIGLIILTLACTNFVNNAIINSIDRAKEIGIRKLAGILPRQLLLTFLSESLLINALAGLLGLVFFIIGLRSITTFTEIVYPVAFNTTTLLVSSLILLILILVSTLLSGLYPATLLMALKPVEALKGKAQVINSKQSSKSSKVMRSLLVFQLAMSIIFISAVYVVQKQLAHMRKNDRQPLELKITAKFGGLTGVNEIYADQSVRFLSGITQSSSTTVLSTTNLYNGQINMIREIKSLYQNDKYEFGVPEPFLLHVIDHHYWKDSTDIFLSGSNFGAAFGRDYNGVIINEAALKAMKFDHPDSAIDKELAKYNGYLYVKGVIKDQVQNERPKVYVTGYRYPTYFNLSLRTMGSSAESINRTLGTTQRQWARQFPWLYIIDRKFEDQSLMEQNLLSMFFLFTFLAVSIACLGIFGLSSFTAIKRTKEIGIRKILGANATHILLILIYDFMRLMFYSSLLAIPIVIFGTRRWLVNYANRIDFQPWFVGIPILIMSAIAIAIIVKQCWQTSVLNPIRALEHN